MIPIEGTLWQMKFPMGSRIALRKTLLFYRSCDRTGKLNPSIFLPPLGNLILCSARYVIRHASCWNIQPPAAGVPHEGWWIVNRIKTILLRQRNPELIRILFSKLRAVYYGGNIQVFRFSQTYLKVLRRRRRSFVMPSRTQEKIVQTA